MALPIFQGTDKDLNLLQNTWSSLINPIISRLQNRSIILQEVKLVSGNNIIEHKLNRKLVGWRIVRKRAAADIFDNQDTNQYQDISIILNSSAGTTSVPVIIDLEVF